MSKTVDSIISDLNEKIEPGRAKSSQWFFKTGKGEYGEGDKFIGVRVPEMRKVAKKYIKLAEFVDVKKLLDSEIHEYRLLGLLILVYQFKKADEIKRKEIYDFYLINLDRVNNWDLVDASAGYIVGVYLSDKTDRSILDELAEKNHLWSQRVAIVANWTLIRVGQFADTLRISEKLLKHEHDLIHKAVGWMLREMGKKDLSLLLSFLNDHYRNMPRTMLRYAIEKLDEPLRQKYLKGKV